MEYVKTWDLAVDVGAHVGTWAVTMAGCFKEVIAFEPIPEHFECLLENTKGLGVMSYNRALGSRKDKASWREDPERPGNSGSRYLTMNGGTIFVTALDDLVLQNVGFLKLDVEGMEPFVIEGAKHTIKRCRPTILVELKKGFEKRYGLERNRAARMLEGFGARDVASSGSDHVFVFD